MSFDNTFAPFIETNKKKLNVNSKEGSHPKLAKTQH